MLSQNDLCQLYEIINEESKSMESIATHFQKTFQKIDHFKIGVTLWFLIKDNLLSLNQRIASFYIIYEMYKFDNMKTTPFVPIVLETIQSTNNNVEKKVLTELLLNGSRELSKHSIRNYIEEQSKNQEEIKLPDLKECWDIHDKEREKLNTIISDWIRPVIFEIEENKIKKKKGEYPVNFNFTNLSEQELSFNYFEPNYLTYYPNSNLPIYDDELQWISPTIRNELIFDLTNSANIPHNEIFNIIDKGIEGKLITPEEESQVMKYLEENPNCFSQNNYPISKLFKVIEKNSKFGGNIYVKIGKSDKFEDYIMPFVQNNVESYTMEAMNIIIQSVEIPPHFFMLFIQNIAQTHKKKNEKVKKIYFKYFVAFINNILEHEHIRIDDLKNDTIIQFLQEYSTDKESANLLQKINPTPNK